MTETGSAITIGDTVVSGMGSSFPVTVHMELKPDHHHHPVKIMSLPILLTLAVRATELDVEG